MDKRFSLTRGQLIIPLARHGESKFYQVMVPFPGEDASVDDNLYPTLSVPTSLPVFAEEVLSPPCPFLRRVGQVYLYHVRDKDVHDLWHDKDVHVCVENKTRSGGEG